MQTALTQASPAASAEPLCPVFGTCGGCAYQHLQYHEELKIKEAGLKNLLGAKLGLQESIFDPIVASPDPYYYRNRLDLTLKRWNGELLFGFQVPGTTRMIPVETCYIARKPISEFIPELKKAAMEKMPAKYRTANLVVRTGDEGRVRWGGIGRGSLKLEEPDYFWTELRGKKIFYSLDTFFQANLSILPALMDVVERYARFDRSVVFYDLYSGVGLFGIAFADRVRRAVLIEESPISIKIAEYTARYHGFTNVETYAGRVEAELPLRFDPESGERKIGIVDPPRQGLTSEALASLSAKKDFETLFYLSCLPEALARDLAVFVEKGWTVEKIIPLDFFPRTSHLETLAVLRPGARS